MLESGFLTAALAFVGIMPAREPVRLEPQIPMTPMLGLEVARPTTTESPLPQGASVSAIPATPMAAMPAIPAKPNGMDVSGLARIAPIHAIPFFIDDWIEEIGECVRSLDELMTAYDDLRGRHSILPPVTKKKLSQLLAANGCVRMYRDVKGKDGARRRFAVFEMRERRASRQRKAA